MTGGVKHDAGKLRFSLVPLDALWAIVRVLEFGARKYAPGNWEFVEDAEARYYNATIRHMTAWWAGEWADSESGEPHLAHAACCLLFCLALALRRRRKESCDS